MKRMFISLGVLALLAGTGFAQNLLTNGNFNDTNSWFENGQKFGAATSFDWSADSWTPMAGDNTYNFYSPNVPASPTGVWYVQPDYKTGDNGGGDYYPYITTTNMDLGVLQSIAAPASGTRLVLNFDYTQPDGGVRADVYGMLKDNPNRQPYNFGWDPLNGTTDPGPDVAHTWASPSECTGDLVTTSTVDPSNLNEWSHWKYGFTFNGDYDFLTLRLGVNGTSNGDPVGVDNVSLNVVHPGDANEDLYVDGTDFVTLAVNYTGTGTPGEFSKTWEQGDFNGDGAVDGSDFVLLAVNYTGSPSSSAVPEPATLSLLGLGLLALRRRRHA